MTVTWTKWADAGDKVIALLNTAHECWSVLSSSLELRLHYSHSTRDGLDTLQGACEELISVNILCRVFLCLITQLAPVHTQPSHPGLEEQGGQSQPSLCHSFDALIHAASLLCSLTPSLFALPINFN